MFKIFSGKTMVVLFWHQGEYIVTKAKNDLKISSANGEQFHVARCELIMET